MPDQGERVHARNRALPVSPRIVPHGQRRNRRRAGRLNPGQLGAPPDGNPGARDVTRSPTRPILRITRERRVAPHAVNGVNLDLAGG